MRNDPMYEIAKQTCHEQGLDYRHPVTGVLYPAPRKRALKREDDPVQVPYVAPYQPSYDPSPSYDHSSSSSNDYSGGGGDFGGGGASGSFD